MSFSVESFNFGRLPETFSLDQVPEWFPSICIPRVFLNIEKRAIYSTFVELFGPNAIERIDVVFKENERGEQFNRVFVHFKFWPKTQQSVAVRMRLLEGNTVNVVYSEPWFWKCSASRIAKPETVIRPPTRPYIDIRSAETVTETKPKQKFQFVPQSVQILRRPKKEEKQAIAASQ